MTGKNIGGPAARRLISAAAAVAALAAMPAGAGAAGPEKGTVVAKDATRQAVAIANARGAVRTVRVARKVRKLDLGDRLAVRGRERADGTLDARRVKVRGKARTARLQAAVVSRSRKRYLVSAGSSTFRVRSRVRSLDSGDIIGTRLTLTSGEAVAGRIEHIAETDLLEIEGIFLGASDGQLQLAVERRGLVRVAVPAGLEVGAQEGDEVEMLVSVTEDGSFSLVALDPDDEDRRGFDFEFELGDDEAEVDGLVAAIGDGAVTVEAGAPSASITCTVPPGVAFDGFAVGDAVEMECEVVDGSFVLRELESETAELEIEDEDEDDADDEDDEDEDEDEELEDEELEDD